MSVSVATKRHGTGIKCDGCVDMITHGCFVRVFSEGATWRAWAIIYIYLQYISMVLDVDVWAGGGGRAGRVGCPPARLLLIDGGTVCVDSKAI